MRGLFWNDFDTVLTRLVIKAIPGRPWRGLAARAGHLVSLTGARFFARIYLLDTPQNGVVGVFLRFLLTPVTFKKGLLIFLVKFWGCTCGTRHDGAEQATTTTDHHASGRGFRVFTCTVDSSSLLCYCGESLSFVSSTPI